MIDNVDVIIQQDFRIPVALIGKKTASSIGYEKTKKLIKKNGKKSVSLVHSDDVDEFLAHHGVKGQRWGVRRASRIQENSDRMQSIAKQRPTQFNNFAAKRIKAKSNRVNIHLKRKENKYGVDKNHLTSAQRYARNQRTIRRARTGAQLAGGVLFVAAMLKMRGKFPTNIHLGGEEARRTVANGARKAEDIINAERKTQISSLKRMHAEGKMDSEQVKNFLKILNARYDRRVAQTML